MSPFIMAGVPLLWLGRKVPEGYTELPGGMHLGKGVWILPCAPAESSSAHTPPPTPAAKEPDDAERGEGKK